MRLKLSLVILTTVFLNAANASQVIFDSGSERVELIELYTSEGCSSCPPADRWLSRLKQSSQLWNDYVPVAFHVGYWDYIGWKDRFAKNEYTQRQRRYAAEFGENTVYTPGVRLNGHEWRSWRRVGLNIPDTGPDQTPGILKVKISEAGQFTASFEPNQADTNVSSAQFTLVLLGQSLSSDVTRGENRGRKLNHDFVALANTTLSKQHNSQQILWSGKLPHTDVNAEEYAVAAWVSYDGRQSPIQTVGGVLPTGIVNN